MKRGAHLYNVGRGAIVDSVALLAALASGHLAGAGLDVTAPEPLPAESPLWNEPGVLITAHSSGLTPRSFERYAPAPREPAALARGDELLNVVDENELSATAASSAPMTTASPACRERSPGWKSVVLVCKACEKRSKGPKKLGARELAKAIGRACRDAEGATLAGGAHDLHGRLPEAGLHRGRRRAVGPHRDDRIPSRRRCPHRRGDAVRAGAAICADRGRRLLEIDQFDTVDHLIARREAEGA